MATENIIIDDRENNELESALGTHWRLITDEVMGGLSTGRLHPHRIEGKACLRLSGDVRLENNGGFIQAALDLGQTAGRDASSYQGILIEVFGNQADYNLHLRSNDVWLPWQSYRASFQTTPSWQTVKLPFDRFVGYRIDKALDTRRLKRVGLVAIGSAFAADLCIARIEFYRDN
ncbi:MAG: CIA30 family protein [Candidatus Thiodiazotropha sp. (ex Notomyrtea botanica)]|nr:CIA30 family protein [Candidatus Thiodiazotropha sp. (ex Notomyrtea botanica)]